jgi:diguanylate cyclase (GGDEF)-like protein
VISAKKYNKSQKRFSLNKVFTSAVSVLLLIFLSLSISVYYQLNTFRAALESLLLDSIPTIISFDSIANRSERLVFYTEKLSTANSQPALRLANKNVQNELNQIEVQLRAAKLDEVVLKEYEAIKFELDELDDLVTLRLETNQKASDTERKLYVLFDEAKALSTKMSEETRTSSSAWFEEFSQLTIMSANLMSADKLNQIRKSSQKIRHKYAYIQTIQPANFGERLSTLNADFQDIVLGDQGLINLRVKQLRIKGRTTGRGNFTEKLVSDFARALNFKSAVINKKILANAQNEKETIDLQIRLLGFFVFISIVLFGFIAWQLRQRVIVRLIGLNNYVSQFDRKFLNTKLKDEISDIALTFESYVDTIEQQKKELSQLAMQDGLTKIANRRAFDKLFANTFDLAKRNKQALSILLIDVDFFKMYNDEYGHVKGDEALIAVATKLKQSLKREVDLIARYGGEEFVCLLPNCDHEGAYQVAENLRLAIEALKEPHKSSSVADHITISIGGTTISNTEVRSISPQFMLKEADIALYRVKSKGRNAVQVSSL